MSENLLPKWDKELKAAKSKFEFECKFDSRLATPDYAKYQAAYMAFSIAEKLIGFCKATDMVINLQIEGNQK